MEKEADLLVKFSEDFCFMYAELIKIFKNKIENLYIRSDDLNQIVLENWFEKDIIAKCETCFDSPDDSGKKSWEVAERFNCDKEKLLQKIFCIDSNFEIAKNNIAGLPPVWFESMKRVWLEEFLKYPVEKISPKILYRFIMGLEVIDDFKNLEKHVINTKINHCVNFYWEIIRKMETDDLEKCHAHRDFFNDFVDFTDVLEIESESESKIYLIQRIFEFLSEIPSKGQKPSFSSEETILSRLEKNCFQRLSGEDHEKLLNYFSICSEIASLEKIDAPEATKNKEFLMELVILNIGSFDFKLILQNPAAILSHNGRVRNKKNSLFMIYLLIIYY